MKTIYKVLLFILLPVISFGQHIEGRVVNHATGEPIKNVNVYVETIEEGTQTFNNGTFYLKFSESLESGLEISFSHVGYNTVVINYSKDRNEYNVSLTPRLNQLDEVEVVQTRQLKPYLTYEKMNSMGSRLYAFGSETVGDKIYVAGGNASFYTDGSFHTLNRLENLELSQQSLGRFLLYSYSNFSTDFFKGDFHVYDIKTDSWERKKDVFKKRANHNAFYYKDKFFVLGGSNLSVNKKKEYLDTTIEIMDLETGEITVDETNPHQAVNFSSFVVEDNLIVLGGSTKLNRNGTKNYSNQVHLLKLDEGLWYELDPMPSAKETTGIRVNNKIYLIGGFNEKPLTTIESFDLNTEKWTHEGNLFFGITNPALAEHRGIIYMYHNGKFFTFDTNSKELNEYLITEHLQNAKLHISGNYLYLLGGIRIDHRGVTPSSNLYRISLNTFNTTQIRRSKVLNQL